MRKLFLSIAVLLGGMTVTIAQTDKKLTSANNSKSAIEEKIESSLNDDLDQLKKSDIEEDYDKIELSEIPKSITRAIARDFKNSKLSKAAVNALGEYKIELSTFDDVQVTVFYEEPKLAPQHN